MKGKTLDGPRINKAVRATRLAGIEGKQGTNHYLLQAQGLRPCPIAKSTNARTMLVPWIEKATGYNNTARIYQYLKQGEWAT